MPNDSLKGLQQAIQPLPSHKRTVPTQGSISTAKVEEMPTDIQRQIMMGTLQAPREVPDMSRPSGWLSAGADILRSMMDPTPTEDNPFGGMDPGHGAQEAITMFSNPALRRIATDRFISEGKKLGYNIGGAAERFAGRYPRVAAHMTIDPNYVGNAGGADLAVLYPQEGKVTKPLRMGYTQMGAAASNSDPQTAINHMFHEGMHAAQNLGNSDMNKLYQLASQMEGYRNNPFEVMARAKEVSNEQSALFPKSTPQGGTEQATAIRMLKDLATNRASSLQAARDDMAAQGLDAFAQNPSPAEQILQILKQREVTPMRSTLTRADDIIPSSGNPVPAAIPNKKYPAEVPPLPQGEEAIKQIRDMVRMMHEGRGRYGIPELEQMGLIERPKYSWKESPAYGQPYSDEDLARHVAGAPGETSDGSYFKRLHPEPGVMDPELSRWFGELGVMSRGDAQGNWIKERAPNMSPEALERILRLLAD